MARTNPRSVLLEYLKGGPYPWWGLVGALDIETKAGSQHQWINRGCERTDALVQRHLCKLIRSRKVVRGDDGRYRLRSQGMPLADLRGLARRVSDTWVAV